MEIESTEITVVPALEATPVDEGFGTRSSTDRPHSMSLCGPSERASRLSGRTVAPRGRIGSRAADILLGVGIGAAAMYYLDASRGTHRRSTMRELVHTILTGLGAALVERDGGISSTGTAQQPLQVGAEPVGREVGHTL
jgi:hypothetical protein